MPTVSSRRLQAFEAGEGGGAVGQRNAERPRRRERGERVGGIVAAGHRPAGRRGARPRPRREADAVGKQFELLAHQLRARAVEAVADAIVGRDDVGERPRFRIVEVEHRLAGARSRKAPNRLRSSAISLWSRLMLVSTATSGW